jgi:Ca-activated chloride channel family protein
MKSGETWYEILEISSEATVEDIRLAYFEHARKYHPDTNPGDLARDWFFQIQEAYETLSDPKKRRDYDESIRGRKNLKDSVGISVKYSSSTIPRLDEAQVVYVMIELNSLVELDHAKIPQNHLCLVIDRSTSMKGSRIEMVKENILQFIEKLRPSDVISIVTFNDRADLLITPTKVSEIHLISEKLATIKCSGSTELYTGIKAGFDLLWGNSASGIRKQMILLTDGHTYGDEEACYTLAQKLKTRGITLNALGIGHEWNDVFLDHLSGLTGGSSIFISNTSDLRNYVQKLSESISVTAAENLSFDFQSEDGITTNYIYRLRPDVSVLPLENPVPMGEIYFNKKSVYLLSFTIPPVQEKMTSVILAKGKIRYHPSAHSDRKMRLFVNMTLAVKGTQQILNPPQDIIEALSRISIYQMQEKANLDVINGHLNHAVARLGSISTQLFKLGNPEMAFKAIQEAELIKTSGKYSKDGDKQLKYGTRALLSPEVEKRES